MRLSTLAERNPDGIALIDGCETVSFAKLFDKSQQLAELLRLDRGSHQPVAFVAENDALTIALIWALLDRELTVLPLNPRLTVPEQRWLVNLAGARLLSRTESGFLDEARLRSRTESGSVDEARAVEQTDARRAGPPVCAPRQTQLLIATSGSTGKPRLVRLSRPALVAAARGGVEHLRVSRQDRWLLSLSLAHIGGISILFRCLLAQASVVIGQPGLPATALTQLIEQSAATLASIVPTQLERWLSSVPRPRMPSLRAILLGGAKAPAGMLQRARTLGWPVLLTYGLSEAGSQVTTQPLVDLESQDALEDAGIPVPGMEVRIDDGTICIRGSMLFDGYLPAGAAPFDTDGWFKTEDLGRITDRGRLIPMGRRDDCIVTGGENVSAVEIETAILTHTSARSAVVVPLNDEQWGQLVAAAVVLGDPALDFASFVRDAEAKLAQQLAPHKRPRRWLRLQELPELPGGKLDRRAVIALFGNRCG